MQQRRMWISFFKKPPGDEGGDDLSCHGLSLGMFCLLIRCVFYIVFFIVEVGE